MMSWILVILTEMEGGNVRTKRALLVTLAITLGLGSAGPLQAQELGQITFATSGAAAAQEKFLEGVKYLHSFQFDEAAVAFQAAHQIDPTFALAYWGEAMSYNHPLWAQVDVPAAKKALERLAPTLEARLAKAGTAKEKAYLEAADQLFYASGDKLARDRAYSRAMAKMYEQWPNDHEVAIFYALSLLGTVRPGDTGYRRQALAASISLRVFNENPKHPGAAHFIIHSFDDPDHAILALPAAREYADIAPSAAHALHMPSHIFVQLGMWPEVAASNAEAYKAAMEVISRLKLSEGREDFHALSWLAYANLMMGKFDEAKKNVDLAKEAADRNPGNSGVEQGYLGMRARYILESAQWERIALADLPAPAANSPGYRGRATWIFIAGLSAARFGDLPAAEKAAMQLRTIRERIEADGNAFGAKPVAIMEREVSAAAQLARGQQAEALRLAKEAADIELTMDAPSGPPDPIKPALEFYGEVLLETNRLAEARAAFEQSLFRMPNRTPSVRGLARAATTAGAAIDTAAPARVAPGGQSPHAH
jgi:tetratricopeptide (TPR) repeat protein